MPAAPAALGPVFVVIAVPQFDPRRALAGCQPTLGAAALADAGAALHRRGLCVFCGDDLRGLAACPECGPMLGE